MSTGLYAVQHIRKMRGGSQSHLMRASDGHFYVVNKPLPMAQGVLYRSSRKR
jgi:hypothetical protein